MCELFSDTAMPSLSVTLFSSSYEKGTLDAAIVARDKIEDDRLLPGDPRLYTEFRFESEGNTKAKNKERYKVVPIDVLKRVSVVFRLLGGRF